MRADRLLSILMLLQTHPRLTARELAERLEVSERTIHRDMEALSAAGVPVIAERGTGGGWLLLDGYRSDLTGLNEAELKALFVSKPAQLLADLGLDKAAEAALIKLLASLPAMSRQDAEFTRRRIHIDGAGWHQRAAEAVPVLPTLQEALWQERKLQLVYTRSDGATVERVVDPLGLVAKASTWYLVGAVEGEARSYRVGRIEQAIMLDQRCERPHNFDLAAFWEQSMVEFKANLPRYPVTVRVDQALVPRLQSSGRYCRIEHVSAPDHQQRVIVSLRFDAAWAACEHLLGFGAQVEILAPAELRASIIGAAQEILAMYVQAGSTDQVELHETIVTDGILSDQTS